MMAFKSHPSVRIKGTENNYEPILCEDSTCVMARVNAHFHCPCCAPTDTFQDPVILKAHFRVKHVDKGVEFAGLKILRCCNTCDIVGSIKGTKEFKGAHWHCYRCKNGFNRRDEALKHYKTHFRNPQTTFQIQICQDVNSNLHAANHHESEQATETLRQENIVTMLHPTADGLLTTDAGVTVTTSDTPGQELPGQVSVAANETVGGGGGGAGDTFMIIHTAPEDEDDPMNTGAEVGSTLEGHEEDGAMADTTSNFVYEYYLAKKEERATKEESPGKEEYDLRQTIAEQKQEIANLKAMYQHLQKEKAQMEAQYKKQIQHYKLQVEKQRAELVESEQRMEEMVAAQSVPLTDTLGELVLSLKAQHENLLHQQLALLKRTYAEASAVESSASELGNQGPVFYITTAGTLEGGTETHDGGGGGGGGSNVNVVETSHAIASNNIHIASHDVNAQLMALHCAGEDNDDDDDDGTGGHVVKEAGEHDGVTDTVMIKTEELGAGDIVDDTAGVFSQHFQGLVELDISRKRKCEDDEMSEKPNKKQDLS